MKPQTEPPRQFFVLLSEEFGFAYWFWVPKMSVQALEEWWSQVPPAQPGQPPLFFSTRNLPGKRILADPEVFQQLYQTNMLWYAHAHWDDDSFLRRPDGKIILHRGHPDATVEPDTQSPAPPSPSPASPTSTTTSRNSKTASPSP